MDLIKKGRSQGNGPSLGRKRPGRALRSLEINYRSAINTTAPQKINRNKHYFKIILQRDNVVMDLIKKGRSQGNGPSLGRKRPGRALRLLEINYRSAINTTAPQKINRNKHHSKIILQRSNNRAGRARQWPHMCWYQNQKWIPATRAGMFALYQLRTANNWG